MKITNKSKIRNTVANLYWNVNMNINLNRATGLCFIQNIHYLYIYFMLLCKDTDFHEENSKYLFQDIFLLILLNTDIRSGANKCFDLFISIFFFFTKFSLDKGQWQEGHQSYGEVWSRFLCSIFGSSTTVKILRKAIIKEQGKMTFVESMAAPVIVNRLPFSRIDALIFCNIAVLDSGVFCFCLFVLFFAICGAVTSTAKAVF